jgi:ketosteroid isomerase-like protein
MTTKMHSTLEKYFAATNEHDVAGMIADLADDAVVKDEGREHRGVQAIREWMKETIRKYKFKAEPTGVARENDRTAVAVTVSGDFPGSPIALTYWFKLEGQKIARLEIG